MQHNYWTPIFFFFSRSNKHVRHLVNLYMTVRTTHRHLFLILSPPYSRKDRWFLQNIFFKAPFNNCYDKPSFKKSQRPCYSNWYSLLTIEFPYRIFQNYYQTKLGTPSIKTSIFYICADIYESLLEYTYLQTIVYSSPLSTPTNERA